MKVVPNSYLPNLVLTKAPFLEIFEVILVNQAHHITIKEFLSACEAGRNSQIAARVCSILHLGPFQKLFRRSIAASNSRT